MPKVFNERIEMGEGYYDIWISQLRFPNKKTYQKYILFNATFWNAEENYWHSIQKVGIPIKKNSDGHEFIERIGKLLGKDKLKGSTIHKINFFSNEELIKIFIEVFDSFPKGVFSKATKDHVIKVLSEEI